MSGSTNERTREATDQIDLDRLAVDSDYRREVMLRLKAEDQIRDAKRRAASARKPPNSRKD